MTAEEQLEEAKRQSMHTVTQATLSSQAVAMQTEEEQLRQAQQLSMQESVGNRHSIT